MKTCFKCNEDKDVGEFYRHPQMADGHLGKCKECTKRDTRANRRKNIDRYRAYDRKRFAENEERRVLARRSGKVCRKRYPEKYRARAMVGNAIRDGRMEREPCSVCSAPNAEAHHEDYSRPLDVTWLCRRHHFERHAEINREKRMMEAS